MDNGQKPKNPAGSQRENSQSSHRKSPKPPYGGILGKFRNESCRASNSVWKTGITSLLQATQSESGLIQSSLVLATFMIFRFFKDFLRPVAFQRQNC